MLKCIAWQTLISGFRCGTYLRGKILPLSYAPPHLMVRCYFVRQNNKQLKRPNCWFCRRHKIFKPRIKTATAARQRQLAQGTPSVCCITHRRWMYHSTRAHSDDVSRCWCCWVLNLEKPPRRSNVTRKRAYTHGLSFFIKDGANTTTTALLNYRTANCFFDFLFFLSVVKSRCYNLRKLTDGLTVWKWRLHVTHLSKDYKYDRPSLWNNNDT